MVEGVVMVVGSGVYPRDKISLSRFPAFPLLLLSPRQQRISENRHSSSRKSDNGSRLTEICGRAELLDMDSPDRTQLGAASVSKIENSPVFNYISTLSPIKPLKAIHTNHAFNSLSLRAITSVFSSPHSNSARESSLLRGHSYADRSKPASPSNGNKFCTNRCVYASVDELYSNSAVIHEHFNTGVSAINASDEPPRRYSKSTIDASKMTAYTCGSPGYSPNSNHFGIQPDCMSQSCLLVPYVQEDSKKGSYEREKNLVSHIEERKEGTRHGLESLISDTGSPLIFTSPDGSESMRLIQDSLDPKTKFSRGLMSQLASNGQNYMHELPSADHWPDHSSLLKDMTELNKIVPTLYNYAYSNRSMHITAEEEIYNEPASSLHNATWRRGLDFEMAGDCRKGTEVGKNSSSSILCQSDEKFIANNKQVVLPTSSGHLSLCILPGIGLHLNSLAKNLKDCKNASEEILSSGRQLTLPCTTGQSHISSTSHEPLFTSADSEREMDPLDNRWIKMEEDAPQASHNVLNDEFYWDSLKRKRLRSDLAGENETCKRCNCKKSKCLKLASAFSVGQPFLNNGSSNTFLFSYTCYCQKHSLFCYCECFASGLYCIEPCSCQECFNKPDHQETVLATRKVIESRNPLAFAPRVIWSPDHTTELGDIPLKTPASSRHKTGCNCKKSSCLKKYCECFQGGVGCSSSCRCEGCKNAFGKKDGIEEETKSFQKNFLGKSLTCTEIQNHGEQDLGSALPMKTPLLPCRPFTLQNQTSCSSFIDVGTPSALCAERKLEKPNILRSQPKLEKDEKLVLEGVVPVYRDCSPRTSFRTASPNSKRVSPLHCDPATRIGRKLILRSIPSFPSLSPQ